MSDDRLGGEVTTFLVERYWPGITEAILRSAHVRLGEATARLRGEGIDVVHLRSALAASDEAVFSFFSARSAADVAAVNRAGAVPFDRIVPVIELD